jgi:hypothetical protein
MPRAIWPWGNNPHCPLVSWVGPRIGLGTVEKRKTFAPAGNHTSVPQSSNVYLDHNSSTGTEHSIFLVCDACLQVIEKSIWQPFLNHIFHSNKSTSKMQQFHKFITWRLCVAQHVSGTSLPIIRSVQLHSVPLVLLLELCWSWDHDQQRYNCHAPTVKPEAPSAVVRSWWWAERCPKHVQPHVNVK